MAGFIADLIFAIDSMKHVEIPTFVGSGLVFCLFVSKSFNLEEDKDDVDMPLGMKRWKEKQNRKNLQGLQVTIIPCNLCSILIRLYISVL